MLSDNDLELLSAYLDGALSEDERAALEARLQTDADLSRELAQLRATVELVSSLPTLTAPRDFRLTPRMVGRRSSVLTSAAFSALSAAAAIALLVLGVTLFMPELRAPETANQVAFAPTETTAPGVVLRQRTEEAAGADETGLLAEEAPLGTLEGTTQPEDDQTFDLALVPPTGSAEAMMFAAPENATLADGETLEDAAAGDAAADSMPAPIDQSLPQQSETLDVARAMQAAESGAGAMSEVPASAQEIAPAATFAPTALATATPPASPTATASPTVPPTATPEPTIVPTPPPSAVATPDSDWPAVVAFVAALILLGVAVVTTILRRRA